MLDIVGIAGQPQPREGKPGLWYEIQAAALYPAMVQYVQKVVAQGRCPNADVKVYFEQAKKLDPKAWEAALSPAQSCPADLKDARAVALEVCRLWFTEVLHQAHGGGEMNVHIIPDPANTYRLYPTAAELTHKERLPLLRFLGIK